MLFCAIRAVVVKSAMVEDYKHFLVNFKTLVSKISCWPFFFPLLIYTYISLLKIHYHLALKMCLDKASNEASNGEFLWPATRVIRRKKRSAIRTLLSLVSGGYYSITRQTWYTSATKEITKLF